MFVFVVCRPPDMGGLIIVGIKVQCIPQIQLLVVYFPQNPSGHREYVCSPNPAGQRAHAHQIHLMLQTFIPT